jgi:hypothetical protein
MSVTSVLRDRPTPYGPISGNTSQSAGFAAAAKKSQAIPATRADDSRVTTAQATDATPDSALLTDRQGTAEARYADPADIRQFQSAFAQARRPFGTTASGSTSETSESDGSQSSAGIALYKRVGQIGNSEPSASELLKSWNSIMQSGQDAGDAGAATLRALLQSGAPAFGSGILDVTA